MKETRLPDETGFPLSEPPAEFATPSPLLPAPLSFTFSATPLKKAKKRKPQLPFSLYPLSARSQKNSEEEERGKKINKNRARNNFRRGKVH